MAEWIRLALKILMWILILGLGSNFVLQTISYSFYKNAKKKEFSEDHKPVPIEFSEDLHGFGANLEAPTDTIILFFGGSGFIAYNAVGEYHGGFAVPFLSADYYGSQESKGKMNLTTMQQTAVDVYDRAKERYPNHKIVAMGHSYGSGMATYLAGVRDCHRLFLLAAYRDTADLYNRIVPIFWGPGKIFISNNIALCEYAKDVTCPTYIIGSHADTVLGADLQRQVQKCFAAAEIVLLAGVDHQDYLHDQRVLDYIREAMNRP